MEYCGSENVAPLFFKFLPYVFFSVRLQKALQLTNLDEILDSDYVNPQNIIHNVTHVNRNGVVTNIDREGRKGDANVELHFAFSFVRDGVL